MTDASRRLIARTALAAISLLYLALAIVPAVFGTDVVLALAGGSPDWLLGPFRIFGDDVTVGSGIADRFFDPVWAERPGGWMTDVAASTFRAVAERFGGHARLIVGDRRGTTMRLTFGRA